MSDADAPSKVQPLGPGDPVEHTAVSAMGATFAERKAAREGKPDDEKAVEKSAAENKAVGRKSTSRK